MTLCLISCACSFNECSALVVENKAHAIEVLPNLAEADIESWWSGLMPFTPDSKALIGMLDQRALLGEDGRGSDAGVPSVCIVGGMGGSGFMKVRECVFSVFQSADALINACYVGVNGGAVCSRPLTHAHL